MVRTIEKLHEAQEALDEARDHAPMGTEMMIREVQDDLESLIERTENIYDGRSQDTRQHDDE